MNIPVDAQTEERRIIEARAELAALRNEIRSLTNIVTLLLAAISPEDARFYAQAQALEAQIGKGRTNGS